jgi:hypothetical protein
MKDISYFQVCAKGKFFHAALGVAGTFTASSGWLITFLQQHNIYETAVPKELHATATAGDSFCTSQKFLLH